MASEPKKLKSILKKPKSSSSPPSSSSSNTPQNKTKAEAERVALQHANIIQQQKDLQEAVFEYINTLLEFPRDRGPDVSPARPSPRDATQFLDFVRTFQPGDYDDLIEERNIMGLCGYALCPKPRRSFPRGGQFKLVNLNKADFDIVKVADLEKWCSDKCARRALYIKIQLSETQAWERIALPTHPIELLEEHHDDEVTASRADPAAEITDGLDRVKLDQGRKALQNSAALALERGDSPRGLAAGGTFDLTIREKTVTNEPKPPGA